MFKVNNKWRRSGIFIVNFEYISHHFLVFLVAFEQINAAWKVSIANSLYRDGVI